MTSFSLTMLPASDGDCLILSWSDGDKSRHAVIDGGRTTAYPRLYDHLEAVREAGEELELYVLTHIDADHIGGALSYLRAKNRPLAPKQVWYNGFRQVCPSENRSFRQGDDFTKELDKLDWSLNEAFEEGVVSLETAPGELEIAGLRMKLLSPGRQQLLELGERWEEYHAKLAEEDREDTGENRRGGAGREIAPIPKPLVIEDLIADGPEDTELPNGSSIAFLAEWQGKRALLTGDAHPDVLCAALAPLAQAEGGKLRVDLLKAPHHGSAKNTTRELIELLACRKLAVSTNGKLHGHPDPEAIARFLHFGDTAGRELHFNYSTDRTTPWNDEVTKKKYDYEAFYPKDLDGELRIDI